MIMSTKNKKKVIKNLIKKPPKKSTRIDAKEFNELINKKEADINREIFRKHFSFQRPSKTLKAVYNTDDKKKNNDLINVIKSELSDSKDEIEAVSEDEKET